jgi:RNA polymerase-interacting CarD/CdnL/TRCF family regulator
MSFDVGETVVHETYGPGLVIEIDQKAIEGKPTECYVVKMDEMTLWVPLQRASSGSLRPLTPAARFEDLFEILRSPGEPLSNDRLERRNNLSVRLKSGTLESICYLIRDLTTLKRTQKMNDHDTIILERSQKFLLAEWEIVLSIPISQAANQLRHLLEENAPKQPTSSQNSASKRAGRSASQP